MMKTYRGSCHCKAVRFEIDADIDHVRVCDCSVCSRRGALIYRVPIDAFRLLTPLSDLSVYRWARKPQPTTFVRSVAFCPSEGPVNRPGRSEQQASRPSMGGQ